jgi:hypothetical protein
MGKDKKNILEVILLLVFFLFSVSLCRAESKVINLSLEKKGDFTYLTIYADSAFEFSHSVEPPKEGKPDRLIIDCYNVTHQLSRNNFKELPSKTITAIRTSQYQEVPQKVTRIVLDLKKPVVYKVVPEEEKNKITIAISTPNDEAFSLWSTNSPRIAVTPMMIEEAKSPEYSEIPVENVPQIAQKTQSGPKSDLTTKTISEEKPKETKKTELLKNVESRKTAVESQSTIEEKPKPTEAEKIVEQKNLAKAEKPREIALPKIKEEKLSYEQKVKAEKPKTTEEKKINKAEISFSERKTATPVAAQPKSKTANIEKPTPKIEGKAVPAPEEKTPTTSVPVKREKVEEPEEEIPTAEMSADTTDTLVQEGKVKLGTIPQRKVLSYESDGRRDPFVPLTTKVSFEFGETPIPNVENLQMVGVLEDDSGIRALLEDDQGYGYIMMVGDKVKNGQVVLVAKDKIIFQIKEYGWIRTVTLELSTEKEVRKKT